MVEAGQEVSSFYLLPADDGSTAVAYLEGNQTRLTTYQLQPEIEDCGPEFSKRVVEFITCFPDEYRLKVSLFKEMTRTLPSWAEIRDYGWQKELLRMSLQGELPDPAARPLTLDEQTLLRWLLFTVDDPKITLIPQSCHSALLERCGGGVSLPSLAYLLEYREGWVEGEAAAGFMAPRPEELFPLLHLYPEAARGLLFAPTPATALTRLPAPAFSLAGITSHRYRVLLMMEYLLHPGIALVERGGGGEPLPASTSIYRIVETQHTRPVALLLYQLPGAASNHSIHDYLKPRMKFSCLVTYMVISLLIIGHAASRMKNINFSL